MGTAGGRTRLRSSPLPPSLSLPFPFPPPLPSLLSPLFLSHPLLTPLPPSYPPPFLPGVALQLQLLAPALATTNTTIPTVALSHARSAGQVDS